MVERNRRSPQSEDSAQVTLDSSTLAESFGSSEPAPAQRSAPEPVTDQARRTSEAAGLAHWTAPPTGHVPKILDERSPGRWVGDDAQDWTQPEKGGWDGPDFSKAFSEPDSMFAERSEENDGFGSRTRDPLADFAGGPSGSGTRDPLADFATGDPNPTGEVSSVGTPSAALPQAADVRIGELYRDAEILDLTGRPESTGLQSVDVAETGQSPTESVRSQLEAAEASRRLSEAAAVSVVPIEPSDPPVDLDETTDLSPSSQLTPKHREVPPAERSIFDLPPSEQSSGNAATRPLREHEPTVAASEDELLVQAAVGDSAPNPADGESSLTPQGSSGLKGEGPVTSDEADAGPLVFRGETSSEPPSNQPADADDEAEVVVTSGPGRDLVQAVSVGLVLAAVAGVALWFGPVATTILITVFAVLAVIEVYDAMGKAGLRPASLLGIMGAASIQIAVYFQGADAYPLVAALTVIFGALWYIVGADRERPVLNLGLTIMGLLWVGGLAGFGVLIVNQKGGIGLLLATIILTVASDTFAYLGGRTFGSTPFHSVSPNKTWEGTMAGFAGALLFGLVIGVLGIFDVFSGGILSALALAAVVGLLAPVGDLAESMIKRDLGLKDMGTLLPGHGGVMDRFDGLLFALPGAYYVGLLFNLF